MENREFHVGDLVCIRQWEDMKREFGLQGNGAIDCQYTFTESMRQHCGDEVVLKAVYEDGEVEFFDEFHDYEGYMWSTDMIEHAKGMEYEPIPEMPMEDIFL